MEMRLDVGHATRLSPHLASGRLLHEDFDGVVQVEFVDAVGWQGVGVDPGVGVEVFGGLPGPFVAVRDGLAGCGW